MRICGTSAHDFDDVAAPGLRSPMIPTFTFSLAPGWSGPPRTWEGIR